MEWVDILSEGMYCAIFKESFFKGQLNSEWIYDVIVSTQMPAKNLSDFYPAGLLKGWTEIYKFLVGILGETMTS